MKKLRQGSGSPCGPVVDVEEADDDDSVNGDGRDGEGGDDDEDGLQGGLEVAEQGSVSPVPSLVHNLHLDRDNIETSSFGSIFFKSN